MLLHAKRKEFKCFFFCIWNLRFAGMLILFSLFRLIFFMIISPTSSFFLLSCPRFFSGQIVVYPTIFRIRMKWNRSFTKRRSKYLNRNRTPESQQAKKNTHETNFDESFANVRHFSLVRFTFFGDWWNRPRQRNRETINSRRFGL